MTKPAPAMPNLLPPEWLAFLTPKKPKEKSVDEDDENPFLQHARILFPSDTKKKKDPHLISGNHGGGDLTVIYEEEQDLVRDISPRRPRRPTTEMEQEKEVVVSDTNSSLSQWFLLLLWLVVAYVTLTTHESLPPSSPEIALPPALPTQPAPPMAPEESKIPVTPPPSQRKETSTTTTTTMKNKAKSTRKSKTTTIPKRIVNIIKQELSPFPEKSSATSTLSDSAESSPSPEAGPSFSTVPSVDLDAVIASAVELQSKLVSKAKELLDAINAQTETGTKHHHDCQHAWKWILDRDCRKERKQATTKTTMTTRTNKQSSTNNNTTLAPIAASSSDEAMGCDNLFLRECRQTKRLLAQHDSQ